MTDRYRYDLSSTGQSSHKYGPCTVCHKHCSEVFRQSEEREFAPGEWTHYQCHTHYGHEECLLAQRRNPVGLACTFRSVPTVGAECYSSVWSEGRECKYCPISCYRAGHGKDWVDCDNERMVREKLAELAEENTP